MFPARVAVRGVATLALRAGNLFTGGGRAARQVQILEMESASLRLQVAELEQAGRENDLLRSLLGSREKARTKTVLCRVIARSPLQWFHTLTIDVGARDGVDDQTVVMDGKGLVGRVYRVNYFTSDVLILSGRREGLFSGVGAKAERSGDIGIVEGDNRRELRLSYLQPDADVVPGDVVITSGLGGVFPRGLPIGVIRSVVLDQDGLSKSAVVIPSADLSHVDLLLALLAGQEKRQ